MAYEAKLIGKEIYNDKDYTNEQSIAYQRLVAPDVINEVLTYTYGMKDDRFPLTMLTEGNGNLNTIVKKNLNDVEFTWDVMGRPRYNDVIVKTVQYPNPGKHNSTFKVWFKTRILIEQYGLIGPDGETRARIMEKPIADGPGYLYTLQCKNPDPNFEVDPELLKEGAWWTLTTPTIPESFSKGNRATSMTPTKMKGQIGFHRFTKQIAGNAVNKVVKYRFKTVSGGTTDLWIDEEMRQFDLQARIMREEGLWLQEYNRNINGEIVMKDLDNGNPIPESAGMFEICANSNYDTYGEELPLEKLDRLISDICDKETDGEGKEIMLFAGNGFKRDFHRALENKSIAAGWEALGYKYITGDSNNLVYGGQFTGYRTPSNYVITLKDLPFLNVGSLADNDKSNGRLHPITGLPISSHKAVCIDASTYDGQRNIKLAQMKGQEWIEGVLKGLTPVPPSWGLRETGQVSTDVDMSQYDVKMSAGLHVSNSEGFFMISSVLE